MNPYIQAVTEISEVEVDISNRILMMEPVNEDLLKKNKYANNSQYVSESVYKTILNKISGGKWSFIPHAITEKGDDKTKYVEYIGMLIVPGFGIHTGIGTQPLNKKDNQNATAAAKTYAFKNACKEMGLAPNVGDDEWDQPVFETQVQAEIEKKQKQVDAAKKKKAPAEKAPAKKTSSKTKPKKVAKTELEEEIDEFRELYDLDSDDDLVALLQIWNEDILTLEEMSDSDWKKFFKYHDANEDEFAGY